MAQGYDGSRAMHLISRLILTFCLLIAPAGLLFPQEIPPLIPPKQHEDVKLPNGKSQTDEILKSDHDKNIDDVDAMIKLGQDLKASLEKNGSFVFSIGDVKKTEEIEKLAKRIRARMKRN